MCKVHINNEVFICSSITVLFVIIFADQTLNFPSWKTTSISASGSKTLSLKKKTDKLELKLEVPILTSWIVKPLQVKEWLCWAGFVITLK
jgi:hypothetical protein